MDEKLNFPGIKFIHEIMIVGMDIPWLGTFMGIMVSSVSTYSSNKKTKVFLWRFSTCQPSSASLENGSNFERAVLKLQRDIKSPREKEEEKKRREPAVKEEVWLQREAAHGEIMYIYI